MNKLSSYNLFNFLIPGATFIGLMHYMQIGDVFEIVVNNVWWMLLSSYVCGLIISRIGSIVVEDVFFRWILKMKGYSSKQYISARKENEMVGLMMELTNAYRTFCALFLLTAIIPIFKFGMQCNTIGFCLLSILLMVLFGYAFRKQYDYFINSIEGKD